MLDTHILKWFVEGSTKLTRAHRQLVENEQCCVSVVSFWELSLLNRKKRVSLLPSADAWISQVSTYFEVVPLTLEAVRREGSLPFNHGDPGDRLIAAAALALGTTLITQDKRLRALRWLPTR